MGQNLHLHIGVRVVNGAVMPDGTHFTTGTRLVDETFEREAMFLEGLATSAASALNPRLCGLLTDADGEPVGLSLKDDQLTLPEGTRVLFPQGLVVEVEEAQKVPLDSQAKKDDVALLRLKRRSEVGHRFVLGFECVPETSIPTGSVIQVAKRIKDASGNLKWTLDEAWLACAHASAESHKAFADLAGELERVSNNLTPSATAPLSLEALDLFTARAQTSRWATLFRNVRLDAPTASLELDAMASWIVAYGAISSPHSAVAPSDPLKASRAQTLTKIVPELATAIRARHNQRTVLTQVLRGSGAPQPNTITYSSLAAMDVRQYQVPSDCLGKPIELTVAGRNNFRCYTAGNQIFEASKLTTTTNPHRIDSADNHLYIEFKGDWSHLEIRKIS